MTRPTGRGWLTCGRTSTNGAFTNGLKQALTGNETACLFLVTPTGSGKTLASYAYAINHAIPAFGVYPTNELIRDQERALKPWIDPGRQ